MTPTPGRPLRLARRARATAAARPAATGNDSRTFVYPLCPAGQTTRAFGFGRGRTGVVAAPVTASPGAVGSGPVVNVGSGAFGSVAPPVVGLTVPCGAPGPS